MKRTGQDIGDLLSSILRIDVDHSDSGRNYRIPPDNPFLNTPGARPEVWAYGLRNPWRMSIDRKTGDLWVGDVGWELWEMLYRIERGGNYGWGVMERPTGDQPRMARRGCRRRSCPQHLIIPTRNRHRSPAGATYYGSRLPELDGVYIYGDYDTGKIWGLRWENNKVAWQRELADTTLRIVGFGEDNAGELYLLDHIGGTINRLVPNPGAGPVGNVSTPAQRHRFVCFHCRADPGARRRPLFDQRGTLGRRSRRDALRGASRRIANQNQRHPLAVSQRRRPSQDDFLGTAARPAGEGPPFGNADPALHRDRLARLFVSMER